MKEFISRLVVYMGSLFAVAMAFKNPGAESIVAATFAVLVYLALDVWWFWTQRVTPHDKQLFEKFKAALPSESGHIKFLLHDHDFGDDFEQRLLNPLNEFLYKWDNEEHRFHDRKLDDALTEFQSALRAFSNEIGSRTAPSRVDATWQTSRVGDGYDGGPAEEKTRENRSVLNQLASDCYELHQNVMRFGRKVLRYQKGV